MDREADLLHLLKLDEPTSECPQLDQSDLPLQLLTVVCLQLELRGLVQVAETCRPFRHGDGGPQTVELPTKSPVVTALRALAFPRPELVPSTRPVDCCDSWVAYLARCVRQRRCQEAPPVSVGRAHSSFMTAAGRLLACGKGAAVGQGHQDVIHPEPVPVTALVRVRSVASRATHSLALTWDGRICSWGDNLAGQLGHGDREDRLSPVLVEGLEGVCGVVSGHFHSLVVNRSGAVFSWGRAFWPGAEDALRPIIVEGSGGTRVLGLGAGRDACFALGEEGELFSWGRGKHGRLGHGDERNQPSPKRVEAFRGVRVSSVSAGPWHSLALAEDGLVYAWGERSIRAHLSNPGGAGDMQPKPVDALRGVRVSSIAAAGWRNYAVADTGEVWAWERAHSTPLGHGGHMHFRLPKPIELLQGIKVDAVAASDDHTLAVADDGSVYAWGNEEAASSGALGLGLSMRDAVGSVRTPQPVPALRVACGL